MALFRALSTRRSQRGGGYDRLLDDQTVGIFSDDPTVYDADHHHHHHHHAHAAVLKRVTSVPASMLFGSSSKKPGYETDFTGTNSSKPKQAKGQKGSGKNSHPVFSLFEGKWRKKKITANPDFSRYIEYLKEGGMLNKNTKNSSVV